MSSLSRKVYSCKVSTFNDCYINVWKKSLICSAVLITVEIIFCIVVHCAAFLLAMCVVAEKIRWRFAQELFQLVHKEEFNLLLKFSVQLGGDLQYTDLLWVCFVLLLLVLCYLVCLKTVQLSPGWATVLRSMG